VSDQLDRLKAALADRYAVEREIGSGGMATVYLARDLRHDRQVAIKVLRPDLAATLGPERFHREIKIAAQLQHPHILPLLDSGEATDPTAQPSDRQTAFLYYVMPYIEGQSLREKLAKEGELPIGEAVKILRDVADALTEAHAHGVVHRDIKPENILLRGRHALVTDFGVAKAVSEATGLEKLTTAGVALGTPAYMAPEQAAADPHLDHRVDIYALGAVAYELLTGRPVFMGTTPQMVLSAHMTEVPDPVTRHRDTVPAALESIVMRCLEKKPADRWRYAEDLLPQFEALATPSGGMTPTATAPVQTIRSRARNPVLIAAVAVVVVAIAAGALWLLLGDRARRPLQPGQTTQLTFAPGLELDPAISPDGRWIAYVEGPFGQMHIHVRPVAGGRAVDVSEGLPGDHRWPQWSPDGTEILFQAQGALYVAPPTGGAVRRIVERSDSGGASSPTWGADGRRIVYRVGRSIMMVTADGAEPRHVADDFEPHSLNWSPDGSRLAYVSGNPGYVLGTRTLANRASSPIRVLSLADGSTTTLSAEEGVFQSPVWLPSGDGILYISNVGGARDVYEVRVNSSGHPIGPAARLTTGLNALTMSLSGDGRTLAYSVFRYDGNIWSVEIPRAGAVSVSEATAVTEGAQAIEGIGVSPDGQWLVFDSDRRGNADIYRMALPDGEPEPLTDDPADDMIPSWSPDGQEIVFYSFRHGTRDLFVMTADGGSERRVTDDPAQERYPDWSPDGNSIVFQSDKTGSQELWVVSREDRSSKWGAPRQLTFDGGGYPRWSPDGRWVAYLRAGVRVIAPNGGDHRTLAGGEGTTLGTSPLFPEWSPDSRTVYFKAADAEGRASFWSIPVTGGVPRLLVRFDDPAKLSGRPEFTTDGERFYFTIGRQESDIWTMELVRP